MSNYKKMAVFDFDGTLVWSPSPSTLIDNVPAREHYDRWLVVQGLPPRKWQGWWGRKETLMPPIFGKMEEDRLVFPLECLNHDLAALVEAYCKDPEILTVLMTGRHTKMTHPNKTHVCRAILDSYGLYFGEYHYNTGGETLTFKCKTFDNILDRFPSIDDVEIFEDRADHISKFWEWVKLRKREGHISIGNVIQVFPPEASFGDTGGEE